MRSIRRQDLAPRVELMPLIDVIFLLLTFFIYALIMMVDVQVLPVELTAVANGQSPQIDDFVAITLDRDGQLHLDRQPITLDELASRIAQIGRQEQQPRVYLACELKGTVDRLPVFLNLFQLIREAGIKDFQLVGQPADDMKNKSSP